MEQNVSNRFPEETTAVREKMHEEARAVTIIEFLQRADGESVQFGVGANVVVVFEGSPGHRRNDAGGGRDFGDAIEAQLGVKKLVSTEASMTGA